MAESLADGVAVGTPHKGAYCDAAGWAVAAALPIVAVGPAALQASADEQVARLDRFVSGKWILNERCVKKETGEVMYENGFLMPWFTCVFGVAHAQ